MPYIDTAFTDGTPATAVYHDHLYVAYKDNNSQRIYMAYTSTPDDPASWAISELAMHFSGTGPDDILTDLHPALTVIGDSLWLAFHGHDNNNIWMVSMTGGAYRGQGRLPDAETDAGPAMAEAMVMYPGPHGHRIWYRFIGSPSSETAIPYASAQTMGTPALVRMPHGQWLTAFRSADSHNLMFTFVAREPGHPHSEWTEPARIMEAESVNEPALAVHNGVLYMAYCSFYDHLVHIASYGDHPWTYHGTIPGVNTIRTPSLVSFGDHLYIFFKGHNNDRVWYQEVPVETYRRSVEIGFRPNPNGFSFENFAEGSPDWHTFQDTFGHSEVDKEAAAATLDLIFTGGIFIGALFYSFYGFYKRFTDGRLNTGLCSAYSAASLRRYWDGTSRSLFTEYPDVASASDLASGIRRELTVDFGRLLGKETLSSLMHQCEVGQANVGNSLSVIEHDLEVGSGLRSARMLFFVPAGRVVEDGLWDQLAGTHTVVPYKIEYTVPRSAGPIRMYVYDCNNPGNNSTACPNGRSYIEFTEADHGLYDFVFYTGQTASYATDLRSSNGLTLATLTLQDYLLTDISLPLDLNFVIDAVESPVELHIHNSQGQFTGHKDGKIQWGIHGSYPVYPSAKAFYLPNAHLTREIVGTGDGPYTYYSLNPDGTGVLVHGTARGGSHPSRETINIDRAACSVSIQSKAGPQCLTVALRHADSNGIRLVTLSNIEVEGNNPLTITHSAGLESVQALYQGADRQIEAEVLHVRRGDQVLRTAKLQPKLLRGRTLQLKMEYGEQLSLKE